MRSIFPWYSVVIAFVDASHRDMTVYERTAIRDPRSPSPITAPDRNVTHSLCNRVPINHLGLSPLALARLEPLPNLRVLRFIEGRHAR